MSTTPDPATVPTATSAPALPADGAPAQVPLAQPTPAAPAPGAAPAAGAKAPGSPEPAAAKTTPAPAAAATASAESKPEVPEPQSALTKKFTEAEWTALRTFRADLPNVFQEAYPDDPAAASKPVTMWGVTLDPAHPNAKASVVLVKFLRARNLNPGAAREMLVSTLRWRTQFDIDALMKEQFDETLFGSLAHVTGVDKGGRPVTYNVYGGNKDLKAVFGDVQRFIRWRVKFMEESLKLLDFENVDQMIQIHDYDGVSMMARDPNQKNAASELSSIFASHYPETLYRKFFVYVPSYMTWVFWLFKPLLPAATMAKFSMVGSGPHACGKALLPYIEDTQLPQKYGGIADNIHSPKA